FVATHKGNGKGKRMLLIAHVDTVFEASSPFKKFMLEKDKATGPGTIAKGDRAIGPGVVDDKGGIAVIVAALRAMQKAGTLKGADITVMFTGDEEKTGDPIPLARRDLIEDNLTFNVGVIGGGTPATIDTDGVKIEAAGKTNVIPAQAIARGDLRSLTPEQDAAARAKMLAITAQHLPGTSATLTFQDNTPPMAPTAGNRALLTRVNAINRDMGLPEMAEYPPAKRGAADSSFVAAYADTLAGMGPVGGTLHAEGEWLNLPSIAVQAKRSAILMSRLAREKR
ncbi:MAG: M20/M25/M40 family metallo-hydrolase, partial [Sphingomonadales bacterium]